MSREDMSDSSISHGEQMKATILNSLFLLYSVFTREGLDSIPDIDSFHFREPLTDASITSEQIL